MDSDQASSCLHKHPELRPPAQPCREYWTPAALLLTAGTTSRLTSLRSGPNSLPQDKNSSQMTARASSPLSPQSWLLPAPEAAKNRHKGHKSWAQPEGTAHYLSPRHNEISSLHCCGSPRVPPLTGQGQPGQCGLQPLPTPIQDQLPAGAGRSDPRCVEMLAPRGVPAGHAAGAQH